MILRPAWRIREIRYAISPASRPRATPGSTHVPHPDRRLIAVRITGVRTVTCEIALPVPIVMGELRFDAREYIVVVIETDQGISGVGFGMTRGAPVAAIVERNLAPLLIGQDAFLTEAIGARLTDRNLTIAGRGIFARALSAVDIALWDIKGQVTGQPIWRLLGGARERIPLAVAGGYADPARTLDDLAPRSQRLRRPGHRAGQDRRRQPGPGHGPPRGLARGPRRPVGPRLRRALGLAPDLRRATHGPGLDRLRPGLPGGSLRARADRPGGRAAGGHRHPHRARRGSRRTLGVRCPADRPATRCPAPGCDLHGRPQRGGQGLCPRGRARAPGPAPCLPRDPRPPGRGLPGGHGRRADPARGEPRDRSIGCSRTGSSSMAARSWPRPGRAWA